jgi:hypothetical protein
MKQTAIDWLIEKLAQNGVLHSSYIYQAKEMEKQQIIHAYGQGVADEVGEILDATKDAEQYYNQKYNSK